MPITRDDIDLLRSESFSPIEELPSEGFELAAVPNGQVNLLITYLGNRHGESRMKSLSQEDLSSVHPEGMKTFHNLEHAKTVAKAAREFALDLGYTPKQLSMITEAALYHDSVLCEQDATVPIYPEKFRASDVLVSPQIKFGREAGGKPEINSALLMLDQRIENSTLPALVKNALDTLNKHGVGSYEDLIGIAPKEALALQKHGAFDALDSYISAQRIPVLNILGTKVDFDSDAIKQGRLRLPQPINDTLVKKLDQNSGAFNVQKFLSSYRIEAPQTSTERLYNLCLDSIKTPEDIISILPDISIVGNADLASVTNSTDHEGWSLSLHQETNPLWRILASEEAKDTLAPKTLSIAEQPVSNLNKVDLLELDVEDSEHGLNNMLQIELIVSELHSYLNMMDLQPGFVMEITRLRKDRIEHLKALAKTSGDDRLNTYAVSLEGILDPSIIDHNRRKMANLRAESYKTAAPLMARYSNKVIETLKKDLPEEVLDLIDRNCLVTPDHKNHIDNDTLEALLSIYNTVNDETSDTADPAHDILRKARVYRTLQRANNKLTKQFLDPSQINKDGLPTRAYFEHQSMEEAAMPAYKKKLDSQDRLKKLQDLMGLNN
jgi:hypothetical protein